MLALLAAIPGTLTARTLDGISFTSLPGDNVEIRLDLSSPIDGQPLNFTIDNPARLAVDLPDTMVNMVSRSLTIGVGVASSITAVEASGRTRVVVNLVELVPYEIEADGNTLVISLSNDPGTLASEVVASGPVGATPPSITGVDFRRGGDGQAQVVVDLSDPSVSVNVREEGQDIVVDFIGAQLPAEFDRRLDVTDFATPVGQVDIKPDGNGTRMVVTPVNDALYEHLAYQSDNVFTLEVLPLTEAEAAQLQREEFTGERLSLNFQDIEVRAVLQLIADFTEFNLVASDSVSGNVTLRLKNVPWDQALDIILKSRGLGMREDGNVILVAPQDELAAREQLELEAQQQISELAPLRTEFVQVNYASAAELAGIISSDQTNLLSDRGNVTHDPRTNTLLLLETADKLEEIRRLVTQLDVPVRQVLIESRIVNAEEDFFRGLGVRFGLSTQTNASGSADGDDFLVFQGNQLPSAGVIPGSPPGTQFYVGEDGEELFISNIPLAAAGVTPAAGIKFLIGEVANRLISLELDALQAESRAEIVSNPTVITANQREAIILSGTQIPFQEASSSGATAVAFRDAVLRLQVTPQITPDDRLILDVDINNDSDSGQQVLGTPIINTQQVSTQVLVDNGQTVVLGGIYQQNKTNQVDKVPFFGDLPYLGNFFRRTTVEDDKSELLIFITPKILDESLATN